MKTKTELRKQISILKTRHASSAWRLQHSAEVMASLEAHPVFQEADTVLLYHSLKDEVDTHDFIRRWSSRKRLLLPAVVGDGLELRLYRDPRSLAVGRFGIEEPVGEAFTDYEAVWLAVVPGVAFDREGNRLGRGKGYYDRLLPHIPAAYKIGICYAYQLVDKVPAEPFDIRMDEIITHPL